jgi:hypothetical protein
MNRSTDPDISVYNDSVYIVYGHENNKIQIYFSYSRDNGKTWVSNIRLTNSANHTLYPTIAVEIENIYVFWKDHQNGDVYFIISSDNGETWGSSERIPNGGGLIEFTVEANKYWVHIVWRKGFWNTGGTYYKGDIYYKRYKAPQEPIKAVINIDPDTLNLKSKGRWITAYIERSSDYDASEINVSSLLLEGSMPAEIHPVEIGDHNSNNISDLMVKFDRAEVEDIITPSSQVELTITGKTNSDIPLEGSDIIRIF